MTDHQPQPSLQDTIRNHPHVSIIVPMFRVEDYIEECIESVLAQTWTDYELILVDDGSPDTCGHIAERYAALHDNVFVIRQVNQGLSEARNTGIRASKGSFIAFLDGDDILGHDDCLGELATKACAETVDIVFGDMYRWYANGVAAQRIGAEWDSTDSMTEEQLLHSMVERNDVRPSASGKLIARSFITSNNLYFTRGLLSEDIEWFLRLIMLPSRSTHVPSRFYMYRQNRPGSITDTVGSTNVEHLLSTVREASIRARNLSDRPAFQADVLTYCCYQLTIAMAHVGGMEKSVRESQRPALQELQDLLAFDSYGFSRWIRWLQRPLGIMGAARATYRIFRLRAWALGVRQRVTHS